ncbi:hypothetical protein [Novosphingobium sp.]|uniref:hypothetical protein n=1 Tax=Novosphingobium sp. TaxID=1874826 RepID=UPI00263477B1|nr:hypothetical protein [Novosphingobium sp.]
MSIAAAQLHPGLAALLEGDFGRGYRMARAEREPLQLAALRDRFAALRGPIGALGRLADEQGLADITRLEDVVPLLFPHTVYKSYPLSFLEQGRFDRLTRWLDGLTTLDLSGFDSAGIDTIDDWVRRLDAQTELAVIHTFGTSGKLSFLPRTKAHTPLAVALNARAIRDFHGHGSGPDLLVERRPVISPSYRLGASSIARGMARMAQDYAGGLDQALFLYPDAWFSADVASLAGRIKAAEARGEMGQLQISPALLARRAEFAAREASRAEDMDRFFAEASRRFAGQDVFLFAVWPILFEWAEEGLQRGLRGLFGPGSVLTTGGGSKGRVLPPDYKDRIFEFLGFERHFEFFGMSELMANAPRCEVGHFHFPPLVVPFVLDPETGACLPRQGTHTGRLALMDLVPESYWGGFVTGDEVTLSGCDDVPCACGRTGPRLHPEIRRFSEARGGDDKINCAGAPEAHDRAVDFLLEQAR